MSHSAMSIADSAKVAMPVLHGAEAARSFPMMSSVRSGSSPTVSAARSSTAALSDRTSLPPNVVMPMPSMPSSVTIWRVTKSRSMPAKGAAPASGSSSGRRTKLTVTLLIFMDASGKYASSIDGELVEQIQVRLDAEPGPLRNGERAVDRLIPVAEGTFGQVAIKSFDHRRGRERGAHMRGGDQAGAEIGRMRRHRDAGLVRRRDDVACNRNAANLGDARLDVVDRPRRDQARKIAGCEHVFADGHWHAAGADFRRAGEVLRRPDRLLDPFQPEFAQRRGRRQRFRQRPGRVHIDHQRAAIMFAQQTRRRCDFITAGLVDFEIAVAARKRLFD